MLVLKISSNIARSTNNVMEALFGDTKFNRRSTSHETEVSSIMPRTLLPWSVIFSPAINMVSHFPSSLFLGSFVVAALTSYFVGIL